MPLLVEAKEISQHPKLSGAYLALAMRLQEAASDMTASHVGRTLSDAVQAAHKGTGKWASYLDHAGDDESGDVIYSAGGDTMSAPYEMQKGEDGTAATAKLDLDSARKVSPRVTYEDCPEDDSDGMETMYEAAIYTRGASRWWSALSARPSATPWTRETSRARGSLSRSTSRATSWPQCIRWGAPGAATTGRRR